MREREFATMFRGRDSLPDVRAIKEFFAKGNLCRSCRKARATVAQRSTTGMVGFCRPCSDRMNLREEFARIQRDVEQDDADNRQREALRKQRVVRSVPVITGYAVTWADTCRRDDAAHGPYLERFEAKCFRNGLRAGVEIRALLDHDGDRVVGRVGDGSLALEEDEIGLKFRLVPSDSRAGREAIAAAETGRFTGVSVGVKLTPSSFRWSAPPDRIKTIERCELDHIGLLLPPTQPSYRDGWARLATSATDQRFARQLEAIRQHLRDLEARF